MEEVESPRREQEKISGGEKDKERLSRKMFRVVLNEVEAPRHNGGGPFMIGGKWHRIVIGWKGSVRDDCIPSGKESSCQV